MSNPKFHIKTELWAELMAQLKKKGKCKRETGAFLLGKAGDTKITSFICYDELDPHVFDTGIIVFNGNGFIPLWKHCIDNKLKVLADVHTHPGEWTGQSFSDKLHPMVPQRGHLAFIVPSFACNKNQLLNGVGIHEFLGKRKWKSYKEESGIVQIEN